MEFTPPRRRRRQASGDRKAFKLISLKALKPENLKAKSA
jgi:hypothetical protein